MSLKNHNPADKVEKWNLTRLIPYPRNSRIHSDEQISQLAASIMEWGWTSPVLVDEHGGIIAGHGRVLAAHKLNIDEVPVIVAKDWSEAKKRAYVIADNKLALNASWDEEILRLELGELDAEGFNLELTGFVGDDLTEAMFGKDFAKESPDDFKEVDETELEKKCPRCGFEFDE